MPKQRRNTPKRNPASNNLRALTTLTLLLLLPPLQEPRRRSQWIQARGGHNGGAGALITESNRHYQAPKATQEVGVLDTELA